MIKNMYNTMLYVRIFYYEIIMTVSRLYDRQRVISEQEKQSSLPCGVLVVSFV